MDKIYKIKNGTIFVNILCNLSQNVIKFNLPFILYYLFIF